MKNFTVYKSFHSSFWDIGFSCVRWKKNCVFLVNGYKSVRSFNWLIWNGANNLMNHSTGISSVTYIYFRMLFFFWREQNWQGEAWDRQTGEINRACSWCTMMRMNKETSRQNNRSGCNLKFHLIHVYIHLIVHLSVGSRKYVDRNCRYSRKSQYLNNSKRKQWILFLVPLIIC